MEHLSDTFSVQQLDGEIYSVCDTIINIQAIGSERLYSSCSVMWNWGDPLDEIRNSFVLP